MIESEVGLTKSDKMVYVNMSEFSHLFKIGVAKNDLIGHNFVCSVWEMQYQISQAAR
jgi:hypothetical protein